MDAVYHLASNLSLTSSYAAIREVNVRSLRNILALCLQTRSKHLFYTSTLGMFPEYICNFVKEFAQARIHHHMHPSVTHMKRVFPLGVMGYMWSKLVSEQILLYAKAAGLPVALFRLPQTGMSSTGFTEGPRRDDSALLRSDSTRDGAKRLLDKEKRRARRHQLRGVRRNLDEPRAAVHHLSLL